MNPYLFSVSQSGKTLGIHLCCYACLAVILLGCEFIFTDYGIRILNNIFIFVILAVSYNLINGVTGQLSLEPNGFVAIGAYIGAIMLLSSDAKWDMFQQSDPHALVLFLQGGFVSALLVGGLFSAFIAFLLCFPVFRVRGDYLAIVTLGFGFIIKIFAENNPEFTNGAIGLNDIPGYTNIYWSGLIALASVILILQIVKSKYGRAMRAVRDDEDAAIAMGINSFWVKTSAFCTSAFLEGVGGVLLAALLGAISPKMFDFMLTFQLLIIIVLGGLGSTTGVIIGTILVIGGGEWLRFLDSNLVIFGNDYGAHPGLRMVLFSLILLLIMLFAREGICGKKEVWEMNFSKKILTFLQKHKKQT